MPASLSASSTIAGDREDRPRAEGCDRRARTGAASRSRASRPTPMLASYCVDATRSEHRLEALALEQIGYNALTEDDVRGKGVKALAFGAIAPEALLDLRWRARRPRRPARGPLAPRCSRPSARRASTTTLELPLLPVLVAIERAGRPHRLRRCSPSRARGSMRELNDACAGRSASWRARSSTSTRPSSSATCCSTSCSCRRSSGPARRRRASTARDVLEELALAHDLPREMLEWRGARRS